MDKSWIEKPINSADYIKGASEFIKFAASGSSDGLILCPCKEDTMRHKSSVVRSLFMPEKDKKGSTYEFKEQQQNKASSSNHKSATKKESRRLSKAAENQESNKRLI